MRVSAARAMIPIMKHPSGTLPTAGAMRDFLRIKYSIASAGNPQKIPIKARYQLTGTCASNASQAQKMDIAMTPNHNQPDCTLRSSGVGSGGPCWK